MANLKEIRDAKRQTRKVLLEEAQLEVLKELEEESRNALKIRKKQMCKIIELIEELIQKDR